MCYYRHIRIFLLYNPFSAIKNSSFLQKNNQID